MLFAHIFLEISATRQAAYNGLQILLMRRHQARGGNAESWCTHVAPVFQRRYGWMLTEGCARGTALTVQEALSGRTRRLP